MMIQNDGIILSPNPVPQIEEVVRLYFFAPGSGLFFWHTKLSKRTKTFRGMVP